jgi:hypothetical protein
MTELQTWEAVLLVLVVLTVCAIVGRCFYRMGWNDGLKEARRQLDQTFGV